jgi:hypothetical protein
LIGLLGNVSHEHARALAGKRQRGRTTDPVRCASHERDLSCEISFFIRFHLSLIGYAKYFHCADSHLLF